MPNSAAASRKERPILFSGPMVRALLAGRKTQTRRIIKPQPQVTTASDASWRDSKCDLWRNKAQYARDCAPYAPGDLLWVRETFRVSYEGGGTHTPWKHGLDYSADGCSVLRAGKAPRWYPQNSYNGNGDLLWAPSIHMPHWASRITLEVLSVQAERLQDITEEDAEAEGIGDDVALVGQVSNPFRTAFADLWESLNGPGSWDANLWVWRIEFRCVPKSEQGGER